MLPSRWHVAQVFRREPTRWYVRYRYAGAGKRQLSSVRGCQNQEGSPSWPYPIYASERISDRRSVFLAHASTLPDVAAFPEFLEHLTSLPALKRASHCMYAYRTDDPVTLQVVQGQNDGGEGGSGDRLSRLLELSRSENVVIVVSRWYGGVKLGPDRWKRISECAKQALERGAFVVNAKPTDKDGGSKGRRSK